MIHSARLVLFTPSRAAFEHLLPRANLGRAILFAASAGLVVGVLGGSINIFSADGSLGDVVVLSIFNTIRFVVALLLSQAIIFGLASTFGAQGEFEKQAYLAALYSVPLQFVGILSLGFSTLAPALSFFVGTAALLYQIVLSVPMLRAVFGDEWRVPNYALMAIAIVGIGVGTTVTAILPQ